MPGHLEYAKCRSLGMDYLGSKPLTTNRLKYYLEAYVYSRSVDIPPLKGAEGGVVALPRAPTLARILEGALLLIVEDDSPSREVLHRILLQAGCEVGRP
jgi:hypothetical protein